MKRADTVKEAAAEIVSRDEKPSATRIARELELPEADVHRCLNHLEREGEVETYTREMLGCKHRMVGVNR